MKIVFVCRNNMFRSRFSEQIAKKICKNCEVKSAGVNPPEKVIELIQKNLELFYLQRKIAKKLNYDLGDGFNRLDKKMYDWADKIIVVADDVKIEELKGFEKKVVFWKIRDVVETDGEKQIIEIIKKIEDKIKNGVKDGEI